MQRGTLVAVVLLGLVLLGVVLYVSTQNGEKRIESAPSEPVPVGVTVPQERTHSVTVTRDFFNPGTIALNTGDTLVLLLTSADETHVVAIPEFGIEETVRVGETVRVQVTPSKAGTISVLCIDRCESESMLTVTVS